MKKFLSILAVIGILSSISIESANAFSWSRLNPWSKCHKCEKKIPECNRPTGYATPCNPCEKNIPSDSCDKNIIKPVPCDACDKLQQDMRK